MAISAGLVSQFLFQHNRWHDIQSENGNENGNDKVSLDDYKSYVPSGLISIGYDIISKDSIRLNLQGFYEVSSNLYKSDLYLPAPINTRFKYYGLRTAVMF